MAFRYYITDLMDGCIKGTNDEQTAKDFSQSEDYFVVDSERDEWLTSSGERAPIGDVAG